MFLTRFEMSILYINWSLPPATSWHISWSSNKIFINLNFIVFCFWKSVINWIFSPVSIFSAITVGASFFVILSWGKSVIYFKTFLMWALINFQLTCESWTSNTCETLKPYTFDFGIVNAMIPATFSWWKPYWKRFGQGETTTSWVKVLWHIATRNNRRNFILQDCTIRDCK